MDEVKKNKIFKNGGCWKNRQRVKHMLERCVQGSTVNQGMRCGQAGRYGVLTGQCQGYVLFGLGFRATRECADEFVGGSDLQRRVDLD